MQFANNPINNPGMDTYLSEARETLQNLGIADVPDEILENIVRDVKQVKEVPSDNDNYDDEDNDDNNHFNEFEQITVLKQPENNTNNTFITPEKYDYTLPTTASKSISLSFDEKRGLFRPPQTPPRLSSMDNQFQYIVFTIANLTPNNQK